MNGLGAIAARLAFMPEPEDQVRLLSAFLETLEPEDRESAARMLAAPPRARRMRLSALRNLVREQIGEHVYALSQDFVGDAAETIALLWQPQAGANRPPSPSDILRGLGELGPTKLLPAAQGWLDACDTEGRHLLLRLVTGTFRPPASRYVLQQAFEASSVRYQLSDPVPTDTQNRQSDLFATTTAPEGGTITAVLLYVHKAASRTAPLFCTFGVWKDGSLLPVGKAPAAQFADDIARHATSHALKRFGPTTQVEHSDSAALLLEVSFEGVAASRRHKSGATLLSPVISAISPSQSLEDVSDLDVLMKRLPRF